MEVTNRKWCDLIAWRPEEQRVWRFERDTQFMQSILPALANFHAMVAGNMSKACLLETVDEGMVAHCQFHMQASMVECPWAAGVKLQGRDPTYSELHLK